MKAKYSIYDVAIIGGGLAGLSLSIQLSKQGHKVILFEKEKYPFHKVCGEYISMESWSFVEKLGVPLSTFHLPQINTLQLTAPSGVMLNTKLPLGGFGISRFFIDKTLSELAINAGVDLLQETKVEDADYDGHEFQVRYSSAEHRNEGISAKVCCGSFGKRSNLDLKWKRTFAKPNNKQSNYVAVKYHVQTQWPENMIGLHNFLDGYCGISKIEEEKYCLCYLTTAGNLKRSGNSISKMEETILYKNPHLKKVFISSTFSESFPVTISQISFERKALVEKHILMVGDAAGMITPLCGNGMSIALHSSKIAANGIHQFLAGHWDRSKMELFYQNQWEKYFASRMKMGRVLQRFFGAESLSNLFVSTFKALPFLAQTVIKKTHGQAF